MSTVSIPGGFVLADDRARALLAELRQLKRKSARHRAAIADLEGALRGDLACREEAARWYDKFAAERRAWPNSPKCPACTIVTLGGHEHTCGKP